MLGQVRLDDLGECEPPRDPSLPSKPLELALERLTCVPLGGESATLDALGAAPAGPSDTPTAARRQVRGA
jgi:hypothetical protein